MQRYLCIHLHFYQPPRENPWLNEIEYQESAYPFHDWNERINVECYRANSASRILDAQGRVVDLANNYARTSFNFGPTLLSWLEEKDPLTYERVLEGDRTSQKLFGGHGSAIAQAYNHLIMPLANRRDKETQIIWGLRDFEKRFGRKAESMWLPETAVDIETLDLMSAHGMKYAILAPRQAKAIRSLHHDESWQDVSGERIDTREAYQVRLPSGRSIAVFFYNGPISKAVAFEGLLHNGETFANRLLSGFDERSQSQLLHIATDGETYGHHHRQGDMALAYALWHLQKNNLAQITNYGQFLELCPPTKEAQIIEETSWSCEHGVERWRNDCGCNSGMKGHWNQQWRAPLRQALDDLRAKIDEPFERFMKNYVSDPWAVRDDYIEVVNDHSLSSIESFFKKWCGDKPNDSDLTKILKALEAQRNLLLMYTSCAWFFDEVSGVETIQNLQYAYRALELSESVFGLELLAPFLAILEQAPSNIPQLGNARVAFERYVLPSRVDVLQVGIHFAIASIFQDFGPTNEIYNSKVTLLEFNAFNSGKAKLVVGHARIRSRSTLQRHEIIFAVVHSGDHNVSAGVKKFESPDQFQNLLEEAKTAFSRADFHETIRVFDRHFGENMYSLKDLFKDERKRITEAIMSEMMSETEERFGRLYTNQFPLLSYLSSENLPIPKVFGDIAEFVDNRGLRKTLLAPGRVNTEKVRGYILEAKNWGIQLDAGGIALVMGKVLEQKTREFEKDDSNSERLAEILDLVKLDTELPLSLNLGMVQNWFLLWCQGRLHQVIDINDLSSEQSLLYELVETLGLQLGVKLPEKKNFKENHVEIFT